MVTHSVTTTAGEDTYLEARRDSVAIEDFIANIIEVLVGNPNDGRTMTIMEAAKDL